MAETLSLSDEQRPEETEQGEEPYTIAPGRPPRHTQFRKGQSGNPNGRPRMTPEMRAQKASIKSLEQHLIDLGPVAAVRLQELVESDDEAIAQRAVEFATEKAIELNGRTLTASKRTVTAEIIEEAQRVLTGGTDGKDQEE